jgi:WhiB family redox-sensing transcriptional regulator
LLYTYRGLPSLPGALCAQPGVNPEMWFGFTAKEKAEAKSICLTCPELGPCQRYADEAEADLPPQDLSGIWGGEDPAERRFRRSM